MPSSTSCVLFLGALCRRDSLAFWLRMAILAPLCDERCVPAACGVTGVPPPQFVALPRRECD
eukprot:1472436-Prymnesium_polylepis.1